MLYLCPTAVSIAQQLDDNRERYLEAVPVCVRRPDCKNKTEKLSRNLRRALTADWSINRLKLVVYENIFSHSLDRKIITTF